MNKESKFISCVVYVHEDAQNIEWFCDNLMKTVHNHFEKYEYIFVDDASTDCSKACIKEYFEKHKEIKLINIISMSYYQGKESSMNAGRDLAIGDMVFEFDQMDPDQNEDLVMEVYRKSLEGFDIVSASPKKCVPITSAIFYVLYNWGSYSANKLEHETFRIISRRAINRINQMNTFIPYRKAMYMNCGLKACTIHYSISRKNKKSFMKIEKNNRNSLAFESLIFFTNIIERMAVILSVIFLGITVLVGCYILYSVFSADKPVEGWMSIMGFMAFGFFGFFLMITLILKYLSTILDAVFRQNRYVVEEIDKIAR